MTCIKIPREILIRFENQKLLKETKRKHAQNVRVFRKKRVLVKVN